MARDNDDKNRIQPCPRNPFYWQYRGRPVLLLGGSQEDNLFQVSGLEQHLDQLRAVGGNYVRCTMSSRDEGNLWPWAGSEGNYDLDRWNDEYWSRFERFLELTIERDIIVQLEIWATWDAYKAGWPNHPLNPRNNSTFTSEESGLPEEIDYEPWQKVQPFFRSVPDLDDLELVRRHQRAFVDELLAGSLEYGHVLYCMDNETNAHPEWGWFWARYVREKAEERGLKVETTEMWDKWDVTDGRGEIDRRPGGEYPMWERPQHSYTLDRPDLYTFLDASQNNTQVNQRHYDNLILFRRRVKESGAVRPINCVKIYGGTRGPEFAGTDRDGAERFWRNVFGGCAAARFHRPPAGIGLSMAAKAHVNSMRILTDQMDLCACEPRNDLLSERDSDEAYCLADPGVEYAVVFTNGGEVRLDLSAVDSPVSLAWLDVGNSTWSTRETLPTAKASHLRAPGAGFHAVLVRPSG